MHCCVNAGTQLDKTGWVIKPVSSDQVQANIFVMVQATGQVGSQGLFYFLI
jgi:hypothetical protein